MEGGESKWVRENEKRGNLKNKGGEKVGRHRSGEGWRKRGKEKEEEKWTEEDKKRKGKG